jgi:hypothetical protein
MQPETPEEKGALSLLWSNVKRTKSPLGSRMFEQLKPLAVADEQLIP